MIRERIYHQIYSMVPNSTGKDPNKNTTSETKNYLTLAQVSKLAPSGGVNGFVHDRINASGGKNG